MRVTITRSALYSNVVQEFDFAVQNLGREPEINNSIKMEVGIELMEKTGVNITETEKEDKIDELRTVFPGKSSTSVKKLLDSAGGDVQQAIILGQSKGFVD